MNTQLYRVCLQHDRDYPLQVEDGGHLCEASELVPDGPGGHGGEIRHKRPKLFIKLQPSELGQNKPNQ